MLGNKNILDPDKSWSSAEKMLDKHFRKKRLLVLFFSLIIPAFIIGIALMVNHTKKSAEKNGLSTEQKNTVMIHSTEKAAINANEKVEKTKRNILVMPDFKSPVSEKTNSQIENVAAIGSKNDIKNKIQRPRVAKVKNSTNNNFIHQSDNKTSIKKSLSEANHSNSKNDIMPNIKKSIVNNEQTLLQFGNTSNFIPVGITIEDQNISSLQKNSFEEVSMIDPYEMHLNWENNNLSLKDNSIILQSQLPRNHKIGWEATVYTGVHYVQKTLAISNDWNNYLQHRKNEEDAILAPSVGLSITASLNSLSISAGIEYSIYGEKTNYYPYSNQVTTVEDSRWETFLINTTDTNIVFVRGNQYYLLTTNTVLDSNLVTNINTFEEYKYDKKIAENNGINRIYYVELPIEISYCLNKGRFGFGLSGGISPAMQVHDTGHYIRTDGRGIQTLTELKSFRKILINSRASVDFYYRAGERTKFVLRPQFIKNLNSVFENSYGIKQKYFSTGILFGATYMIN